MRDSGPLTMGEAPPKIRDSGPLTMGEASPKNRGSGPLTVALLRGYSAALLTMVSTQALDLNL